MSASISEYRVLDPQFCDICGRKNAIVKPLEFELGTTVCFDCYWSLESGATEADFYRWLMWPHVYRHATQAELVQAVVETARNAAGRYVGRRRRGIDTNLRLDIIDVVAAIKSGGGSQ